MNTNEVLNKLIAEIERLKERYGSIIPNSITAQNYQEGRLLGYKDALYVIKKSLQQEQPMPDSTKLIEFWHEDKEMLKEKDFRDDPWRLAYNAFMCGFGRGIAVNKQEQPKVDLEKEKERFIESFGWGKTRHLAEKELINITARHFYELGLNARKEVVL